MRSQKHEQQRDQVTGQAARDRIVASMPVVERRLHLAGVSTAVLEGGDGPPMVLLHGQGEFAAVWLRVLPDLVRTHRVVVPDLPGQGESRVTGAIEADTVMTWLDELIDTTCADRPVLVGHLLGGAIAARYASGHGDRLAHLALVDSMGLARYLPSPSFALPMIGFLARPTAGSRDRLFDRCFLDFDRVGDEIGEAWPWLLAYALDRARTPSVQSALRRLITQLGASAIPSSELERITVPVTLIHGRHDLQIPLRTAEKAGARYGWPVHVIEDARDDPAAEQPEALIAALRTALDHH